MKEQNRDDFYEGPPLEDEARWHDGAVVGARDEEYQPGPPLDHERNEPLAEVELPERGAYPLPDVVERPHQASDGLPPTALTRDPSLSRAADREAAGAPVADAGYDRSIEGEAPGPLAPEREAAPDAGGEESDEELPAGQWGSSGSRP